MPTASKKRVLVGLSGWVDSAVTAYLLQKEGYEVTAGFMKNYVSEEGNCTTREDRDEALKVATHLGIKNFLICDFREEYQKTVVDYIYAGYQKWITPNGDILCNSEIKFKLFLNRAIEFGFDYLATGHYARITQNSAWAFQLLEWIDNTKDQSYFLAGLNQFQLSKSLFPVGWLHKTEVRKIAKEIALPNAERKDSQGICFVGKVDMADFLKKQVPTQTGNIVNTSGKILGKHEGVWFYTIGQRRWIAVWWWPALFVVAKNLDKNELIVWTEDDLQLFSTQLQTTDWHWVRKIDTIPETVGVKIRYRQSQQTARLVPQADGTMQILFTDPQRAVSSGQTAAVYIGEELVGSGTIL